MAGSNCLSEAVEVYRVISGQPLPSPELTIPARISRGFQAQWGSDYLIRREREKDNAYWMHRIEKARPLHGGSLYFWIDCRGRVLTQPPQEDAE